MVLDSRVETVEVVMEVSMKAAGVLLEKERTPIELTVSARRSSNSPARPHPVPVMAPLQDMEPFMAPISGLFSAPFESDKAKFVHPLVEVEGENGAGSQSLYF